MIIYSPFPFIYFVIVPFLWFLLTRTSCKCKSCTSISSPLPYYQHQCLAYNKLSTNIFWRNEWRLALLSTLTEGLPAFPLVTSSSIRCLSTFIVNTHIFLLLYMLHYLFIWLFICTLWIPCPSVYYVLFIYVFQIFHGW